MSSEATTESTVREEVKQSPLSNLKKDFSVLREVSGDKNFQAFLEQFNRMKAKSESEGMIYEGKIKRENHYGNIEYKLKLINPTLDVVQHRTT